MLGPLSKHYNFHLYINIKWPSWNTSPLESTQWSVGWETLEWGCPEVSASKSADPLCKYSPNSVACHAESNWSPCSTSLPLRCWNRSAGECDEGWKVTARQKTNVSQEFVNTYVHICPYIRLIFYTLIKLKSILLDHLFLN